MQNDDSIAAAGIGWARFEWGHTHLAIVEEDAQWASEDFDERVGIFRNEAGANLYHFMVMRCLKTAKRCFQAGQLLLSQPHGSIPVEILLRSGLTASAKALYLLQPLERESRERRFELVYRSDRAALGYAVNSELRLLGLDETTGRQQNTKAGVRETKILRDVLDELVAEGNCQCGKEECPQYDLEGIRHRVMRAWWLYSSVTHVNLWHIEKATEVAPSEETMTTGDIGENLHDIAWIYARTVSKYLERYDLLEYLQPLDIDWR